MAKRKAGVNDIIYELDNDDIELSSEDERKETKIGRFDNKQSGIQSRSKRKIVGNYTKVIKIDSSSESICDLLSPNNTQNGGKNSSDTSLKNEVKADDYKHSFYNNDVKVDKNKRINKDYTNKTVIFDEDIAVDSPASNSDLGVVGCENRIPLVTVRFKDSTLAHTCKQKVRDFFINLLKSQNSESGGITADSDTELDIWAEDLIDEDFDKDVVVEDNLFFVDTAPCDSRSDIPTYSQTSSLISNVNEEEKDSTSVPFRRKHTCFNCDGEHQLKDCSLPRNNLRIAANRKTVVRVGRYHVEDDQKYGHLVPGRISGNLRHALGLKRYELPLYIYRMRLLGYPPGWLEEARISHSGIIMFDSTGNAIKDPEEEDGELNEPGSKDKFDIKKILDFPGFNVSASSRYIEEGHLFGLPPMSDQDSKMVMLQMLAPNAMKAYKRKKLTFFPSASRNCTQTGQVEMELDSGDEIAEFPSIPPLPDDVPPQVPPPPPPPPENAPEITKDYVELSSIKLNKTDKNENSPGNNIDVDNKNVSKCKEKELKNNKSELDTSDSELEVVEVIQVMDIPIPEEDLITIYEDDDDDNLQVSSGRNSPSLDALEAKKRRLLDALKGDVTFESDNCEEVTSVPEVTDSKIEDGDNANVKKETGETNEADGEEQDNIINDDEMSIHDNVSLKAKLNDQPQKESQKNDDIPSISAAPASDNNTSPVTSDDAAKTADTTAGQVKATSYGAPVLNVASPYLKLPSDDKFAKDICDIINFENLPNSTGKFKKISNLLKKVKSEVDRIQES